MLGGGRSLCSARIFLEVNSLDVHSVPIIWLKHIAETIDVQCVKEFTLSDKLFLWKVQDGRTFAVECY